MLALSLAPAPISAQVQPQGKPFLAVLEFENRLGDSQESRDSRAYLTDVVRNRAKDLLPWLELITKENVVALLASQGKTLGDCQKEGECEVQTGERLGADYVVSGSLVLLGGELRLILKLHDTHTKGLLKGLNVPGKDVKELEANLPRAVDQLLAPLSESGTGSGKGPAARATTGELFLSVSPPGATWQLDGGSARALGASGTALVTLPLGKHRVLLRLSGYQDAVREVLVQAGAPYSLKETLLRPPPPRGATRGKGFLTVESTPDQASIFLDGQDTGKVTPANFKDLAPGEHEVVLKRSLYLDHSERRVLRDDVPVAMVVPLDPDFGDLVIESTPPGAAIALDGALQEEKTPATLKRIASGAHRIELSLARHDGEQQTLLVEPGGTKPWKADLRPIYAQVAFESVPSGATVFVDDVEVGQTPLARELDRGPHRVRLRMRLYAEHAEVLVVEAGKAARLSKVLSARFGSLSVQAMAVGQPVEGAEVFVQGQRRGKAPLALDELPEGVVTVEVRAALHQGFTTEVKIAAGPTREVLALLVPEYGFVLVKAD